MKRTTLAIFATLLMMASTLFASTQASNATAVSPQLKISATIQDAVQLTLVSGTGCALGAGTAPVDYTMDFGTVDALAIANGTCGNKYTPAQTGTDAIYYSDYVLKPVYTSQPTFAASKITAYVSTPFSNANISVTQSSTGAANSFSAMSLLSAPASQTSIAASVGSNSSITRYIGVDIAPTNGAGLTGAQSAVVTFTLTVQ